MRKNNKIKIIILLGILAISILFSITVGAVKIPLKDTVKIISSKIGFLSSKVDISNIKESNIFIVLSIRLPRILLAALVGSVLAVVGSSYQAIFKNPMADPYVMGVSSGAAFGATIGIVLGLNKGVFGFGITSIFAFVGALITTIIVYNLARVGNKISTTSILLAGIVMSSILSAGVSIMMIFNHDELASIVSWTMGSFNGASWKQIGVIVVPVAAGLVFLVSLSREMNAIVMGEEDAQNMGVNVERVKKMILVTASLLSACVVSVSGIIGFVGIIVPHLFRLLFDADHKMLLPVSAIGGGIFLLLSDTLARTIVPGTEIPVGIITSIFGGPFFLYLLKKSKSRKLI
ncbi:iron ABC transporter permease [Proteiniborus sp. MB09-C3]|uniref:FecCD family ABC transporter permease n=1 Tax=Proteiniborus sp. MB09-C3 TaxID=3050072 RepID=UPI002555E12E|nr:iron ABC transporter permease [Proteiniborus sp. MB09-C3]WIV11816.1 iron ABC transporter permease [Proteiniborus sp. MB09-C3]